jgi:hemoglobin
MKKDITNQADVEQLVRTFYTRLLADPLMSPFFKHIDFEAHFPRMIAFWAFILIDTEGFTGNVFDVHRNLDIDERHFERWITTFQHTVDDLFMGKKADKAKNHAEVIGYNFLSKLKYLKQ